mmetsp:Transcript_4647/g.12373  ORF Transcript_4647/g.12373 Transcript_4647/m.12373 type:complete len:107 (+) Transcript_4647:199-519(+)
MIRLGDNGSVHEAASGLLSHKLARTTMGDAKVQVEPTTVGSGRGHAALTLKMIQGGPSCTSRASHVEGVELHLIGLACESIIPAWNWALAPRLLRASRLYPGGEMC